MKKYPTFCILPFTHIGSTNDGNYRVCCYSEEVVINDENGQPYNMRTHSVDQVWNSDFYKTLRKDLLNGVKNPTCQYCWEFEDRGAFSRRQKSLVECKDLYPDYEPYIQEALNNDYVLSEPPTNIDLKIGTLCNLKCIMCYPGSSSLHHEESLKMKSQNLDTPGLIKMWDARVKKFDINMDNFNPKNLDVEQLISNLEPSLKQAKHLSIVGGEPLVNPATIRLLERCVEAGYAEHMMLQIITNLSTINDKTLRHLDKFKHPMLNVSYDHVDPDKFYFIRHPADYNHFRRNFDKIFEFEHIEKKLSTTWGIFNIFDVEEIFENWEEVSNRVAGKFTINMGMIYYPNYFNLKYLDEDQKDLAATKFNQYLDKHQHYKVFKDNPEMVESIRTIRGFMGPKQLDFDQVVKERTRVLDLYDSLRNTDHMSLFPYLRRYE